MLLNPPCGANVYLYALYCMLLSHAESRFPSSSSSSSRTEMRLYLLLTTAGLLSLPASRCVNYVHDELLWTKQSWDEHKLPFPWKFFSKREPAVARLLESDDFVANSLNGPLGDIKAEVEQDIKRGVDLQPSRFDVSLLNEEASQDAAAGVAQCKVCMALASTLWKGLVAWVDMHEAVPSKKRIAEYGLELCEQEVPNEVLRQWVLLRAKVQPSQVAPLLIEGNQEFYMLSQRQKQHATPAELAATQLACKKLIKGDSRSATASDLVKRVSSSLTKYYEHLELRLGKSNRPGGPVEAVDEGPHLQHECVDRHPQCEKWAEKGECEKNPTYMVGDEHKYIGQCRRACGACTPPADPKPEWSESDEAFLTSVSTDYMYILQTNGCARGPPCAGATGAGMEQLLAIAGGGGKKGEDKGGMGGFISGPLRSTEEEAQEQQAQVDPERIQSTRVIATRPASDSFVKHSPPKKANPKPPSKLPSMAAKALWQELGGQCLYSSAGWWTYEVCFADSITQFHVSDSQQVDWVICLGKLESMEWDVHNTTNAGLYVPGTEVPYLVQHYSKGNDCELTEELYDEEEEDDSLAADGSTDDASDDYDDVYAAGHGKGRQGLQVAEDGKAGNKPPRMVKRETKLLLMCSPDLQAHIHVEEPKQCSYVVELYLPSLCRLEGFVPLDHDLPPTGLPEVQ